MPRIICRGICHPNKPFGQECGDKVCRRAGRFCTPCKNNAMRLLLPDSVLSDNNRQLLQAKWNVHLDVDKKEKEIKNRNNGTFRGKDRGANKRKHQTAQNEMKAARRAPFIAAKKAGDHAGLVAAAYATARYQNRQATAIARGFDSNFDFVDNLASGNIHLLAAAVTDASVNAAESVINFGSKAAATKALADLMIDYKKLNKEIMQYSCQDNYNLDAAPNLSSHISFLNRAKTKSKNPGFLRNFAADDHTTIEYLESIAEEVDELREEIQNWYKVNHDCGVVARRTTHRDCPYPSKEVVEKMVLDIITDDQVLELFIGLLNNADPNEDEQLQVESILNGSFYFATQSTTAFHFCPQLLEFGFPSSRSNAVLLNRAMWDDLIARGVAQGHSRRDMLAKFLMVWAGMDGSICENYFEVIIPDNAEMISFFREIITELHEGEDFSLPQDHAPSDFEDGKDIVYLTVSSPHKLCSVMLNVLGDDNQYVPTKKAHWLRRHAATWNKRNHH